MSLKNSMTPSGIEGVAVSAASKNVKLLLGSFGQNVKTTRRTLEILFVFDCRK
jgi:hypothetical protein